MLRGAAWAARGLRVPARNALLADLVPAHAYVNGAAFLAFSSIAERSGRRIDDGRSLSFLGGLAEGAETIVVHTVWLLLPFWAPQIAVGWAAVVAVSGAQRIVAGYRALH